MVALGRAGGAVLGSARRPPGLAGASVSPGGRRPVPSSAGLPSGLPVLRPSRPPPAPPTLFPSLPGLCPYLRPCSVTPTPCPSISLCPRPPPPSPCTPPCVHALPVHPPSPSPSASFLLPRRGSIRLCPRRSLSSPWPSLPPHRGRLRRRPPRRRTPGSDGRPTGERACGGALGDSATEVAGPPSRKLRAALRCTRSPRPAPGDSGAG